MGTSGAPTAILGPPWVRLPQPIDLIRRLRYTLLCGFGWLHPSLLSAVEFLSVVEILPPAAIDVPIV